MKSKDVGFCSAPNIPARLFSLGGLWHIPENYPLYIDVNLNFVFLDLVSPPLLKPLLCLQQVV